MPSGSALVEEKAHFRFQGTAEEVKRKVRHIGQTSTTPSKSKRSSIGERVLEQVALTSDATCPTLLTTGTC